MSAFGAVALGAVALGAVALGANAQWERNTWRLSSSFIGRGVSHFPLRFRHTVAPANATHGSLVTQIPPSGGATPKKVIEGKGARSISLNHCAVLCHKGYQSLTSAIVLI